MDHSCYFCRVFALLSCASVYCWLVVTCWERGDLLALVWMSNCEFVTFPFVSGVSCGTWLYRSSFLLLLVMKNGLILYMDS